MILNQLFFRNKGFSKKIAAIALSSLLCTNVFSSVVYAGGSISSNVPVMQEQDITADNDAAYVGKDKTSLMSVTAVKVIQKDKDSNDVEISTGGTIDNNKNIKIGLTFTFPVIAEAEDSDNTDTYIKGGDTAYFTLPADFTLVDFEDYSLKFDGIEVGTVSYDAADPGRLKVSFTDEMNDESLSNIQARFEINMKYTGNSDYGTYDVVIFDEPFVVNVSEKASTITGNKDGTIDVANKKVHWVVKVNADYEWEGTENDGNLVGYTFVDDLTNVGEYVADSLKISKTNNIDDAAAVTNEPQYVNHKLTYDFIADEDNKCIGTRYLFFDTEIPDEKYNSLKISITNTGEVYKGDEKQTDFSVTKEQEMKWIDKKGEAIENNTKIKWTITVNETGASMKNVVIEDSLPSGITFESAYDAADNSSIANSGTGENVVLNLGNLTEKKEVVIITTVDDTSKKSFCNKATLKWDGCTTGMESNEYTVEIKNATIKKEFVSYDASTHKIQWKVTVDIINPGDNYRVLDLFIYGDENPTSINEFSNLNDVTDNSAADLTKIHEGIVQNFLNAGISHNVNQKLVESSLQTTDNYKYKVHHLKDSNGDVIADFMVIVADDGTGLGVGKHEFTYETYYTNPDGYARNNTEGCENRVYLFNGSIDTYNESMFNDIQTSVLAFAGCPSYMLKKVTLDRDAAARVEANINDLSQEAVNYEWGNWENSFCYDDKSVIYKVYVNANGIDSEEIEGTKDGEKLGSFVLKDQLPENWEFKKLNGQDFVIYEGTGNGENISATAIINDYSDFLTASAPVAAGSGKGGSIELTFNKLQKSYVILFKVGLTEEGAKKYFSTQEKYENMTNTVTLDNAKLKEPSTSTAHVNINSNILSKTKEKVKNGVIKWMVDYKPYGIEHPGLSIVDTLPYGVELRVDSEGKLIVDNNIVVYKLKLERNGGYTQEEAIDLSGENILSYNSADREFKFIPPDTSQAYRITYLTDITMEKGEVNNSAEIKSDDIHINPVTAGYTIEDADVSITLKKNGYIKINKINPDNEPLKGAEFTLYSSDKSKVIKKAVSNAKGIVYLTLIPEGSYILKETTAPDEYLLDEKEYQIKVAKDADNNIVTTVENDNSINCKDWNFVNLPEGKTGNLSVTKYVTGTGADTSKSFAFTACFKDTSSQPLTGSYHYIIRDKDRKTVKEDVITLDEKGEGAFSLSDGQNLVIYDIPKRTIYEVSEKDYSAEGYIMTISGEAQGTIEPSSTKTVAFTNMRNVGYLEIKNTVEGNGSDTNKKFEFTVYLDTQDNGIIYPYIGKGIPDGIIQNGGKIELSHGQSIIINGIQEGITYRVTESDYSQEGYVTTMTQNEGIIQKNIINTASFVNTRNIGTLSISKKVERGDKERTFNFIVSFSNNDAVYSYTGIGVPDGVIKSGDVIALAHNQSIIINGIPDGETYVVEEEDYTDLGYETIVRGGVGVISHDTARVAGFINNEIMEDTQEPPKKPSGETPEGSTGENEEETTPGQENHPGKGSETNTEKNINKTIAKTGDNMPLMTIIIVTLSAMAGMILLLLYKKKLSGSKNDERKDN